MVEFVRCRTRSCHIEDRPEPCDASFPCGIEGRVGDLEWADGAERSFGADQRTGDDLDGNVERAVDIGGADSMTEERAQASGESFDGEQERDFAHASPAAAIEGEAAAGKDAVDMGMEHQGLTQV